MKQPELALEEPKKERFDIEKAIVIVLAIGIATGSILTLVGLIAVFVSDPSLVSRAGNYHLAIKLGATAPHNLKTLFSSLAHLKPIGVLTLGIGIIILTPVMRVGISIISFLIDSDYKFVIITTIVFLLLIGSMIFAPSL